MHAPDPDPGTTPPPDGAALEFHDVAAPGLDSVSFTVAAGQAVLILGPQAGTVVDLVLGLVRPDRGTVRVLGTTPSAALRAGRVGAMHRAAGPMPGVTVGALLAAVRALAPRPMPTDDLVRQAGIASMTGYPVDHLEPGYRRRVGFGLALAGTPDLLVLDRPSTGMDQANATQFWGLVRAQGATGRSLLIATDDVGAQDIADRVLVVHEGRILTDTTPAGLRAEVGVRVVGCSAPDLGTPTARTLPGVVEVAREAETCLLYTLDPDATVAALHASGCTIGNLTIAPIGLDTAGRLLADRVGQCPRVPAAVGGGDRLTKEEHR